MISEKQEEIDTLRKENEDLRENLSVEKTMHCISSTVADFGDEAVAKLRSEITNLRKVNEELKVKDTGLAARMAYEAYESEYGVTKYNCLEAMEKILDELYPPRSEESE